MSSCSLWRACTAAWWPGWGWGAPSAWRGPSECRGSSRRGSSAPCPPANTRVTRDFGDPRDTCHVTAAALSCTWRAGLLIWLWMHFIFYHKLISIHAALRQFVFRGDNTMDPAFRSSRNKQKEHVYKIPLSYRKANFVPNEKKRNGICFISSAMFERWSDIQTMASYQDIHGPHLPSSVFTLLWEELVSLSLHSAHTEHWADNAYWIPNIPPIQYSSYPSFCSRSQPSALGINIFDILGIYVYFRKMFVFLLCFNFQSLYLVSNCSGDWWEFGRGV